VERGVRNPSLTALVSLADGLGISVSVLLKNLEIEADRIQ
jgi:transcriptional regulator with XRE-family HTH domain